MHILVVNEFHRRVGGGGTARLNELAKFWTRSGHRVTVVASPVDHASGQIPPELRGRWVVEEEADGARVRRTWTLGSSKSTPAGRLARDLSFTASSVLAQLFQGDRPDVIVASSPPLTAALAGALLGRLWSVPVVFEVRDLWPDIAVEFGALRGPPARIAFAAEAWLYRTAARVATVTPGFIERIHAKGVPREKIVFLPNGVDLEIFSPGPPDVRARDALGGNARFIVLYAGVHGPAQALAQAVEAARLLSERAPDVLFVFVGDGEEKPALQALAQGLPNVWFRPQMAREDVPRMLRAADVALVTLKRLPGFHYVYPAKVFEAMGCGRPVLLAAEGDVAKLVAGADAGVAVPPESPQALADAVLRLRADRDAGARMGRNGASLVARDYDRRELAERYLRLFEEIVGA